MTPWPKLPHWKSLVPFSIFITIAILSTYLMSKQQAYKQQFNILPFHTTLTLSQTHFKSIAIYHKTSIKYKKRDGLTFIHSTREEIWSFAQAFSLLHL